MVYSVDGRVLEARSAIRTAVVPASDIVPIICCVPVTSVSSTCNGPASKEALPEMSKFVANG